MSRLGALALASLVAACVPGASREAREARLHQLCRDPRAAYEKGHNEGLERRPLDSMWIDQYCVPHNRDQQRKAYTDGYQTGIQYAPAQVNVAYAGGQRGAQPVMPVGAPPQAVMPVGQACRFSSDCAQGQSCRRDRAGAEVCMGFGQAGSACWFSSDCLSQRCDDKVCR